MVVVPDSTWLSFQVHIARKHINILSHAVIDLTRCVTESVLISLDIFPDVHSSIHNILKII